uniref:Si:ch211-1e14.1 n=1 Tax=Salarias fasciatus TaxID=181472 RepID=A0A672G310_SALFA
MPFHWGNIKDKKSKSTIPKHFLAEEPQTLTAPSLNPLRAQQLEAPVKLSADEKMAWKGFSRQSSPHSLTPTRSPLQALSISTSPPAIAQSTPQFGRTSEETGALGKQQGEESKQTLTIMTSKPDQPPKLGFTHLLADESYSETVNQFIPSSGPLEENKSPNDINILPNPDAVLSPGYHVPFIAPHPTSPSPAPTELPLEDFYPTNTMDIDWGSGDYLETMSFFDSDRDDYSLVTKVPSDPYDLEDYTETYDTSFPARVGISPSSLQPSPSLTTSYSAVAPLKSVQPPSISSTAHFSLEPSSVANSELVDMSDVDWADTFTIQPTDVLLPDMNSLEYYTTQLSKDNNSSETGAEHRGNVTVVAIDTTDVPPTSFSNDPKQTEEESSGYLSGFEPDDELTTVGTTQESPKLTNSTDLFLDPSIVPTHFLDSSSSVWDKTVPITEWSFTAGPNRTASTEAVHASTTPLLPDDLMPSSSLTDVHWFVTESIPKSTTHSTTVLTSAIAFSSVFTEPAANSTNVTVVPPFILSDQGVTEDGVDNPATTTLIAASSEVNTLAGTTATTTSHQATTGVTTTTTATTARQYLCNLDRPAYLVKIGFPSGATIGHAKTQIRDILKGEFNKSVELQVVDPPPKFVFRAVSGPVVYTAVSVINALRRSGRRFLSVSPNWAIPDRKYQVHTVLQFVPGHVDVRFCNFSEGIEKGLTLAFAEVRRRSKESTNFTVHVSAPSPKPVDITFTVRGPRGHLAGSEVSNALMKLTTVEFSYYMGFPVLQIAEPFHYPELNTSQLLRSSWVRTVLLGVLDQKVGERTFQASMERRVAMLLGEAMESGRRVKRATAVGNSSVQVVSASRLVGADHPLEIVYFVEGPNGQRIPAVRTADLLNHLDVQRAAIVLGYRVQGVLAQPVEKVASSPSDTENTNLWIVIGVVVPLLLVVLIISILYWKLCRTDKLEFQPDAMTSIQQRQKLQAPSVKGFDFAKLHLGQQSKDEVMVIQESVPPGAGSGPLPLSIKDGLSASENGEIPTPISKASASSTKASRSGRRRERISPSDGDSVVSDRSSERDSTEENLRVHATPSDSKQTRKVPINVLNGPPPANGTNEQLSSAAIFEHVDRMSRAADASRRLPNKVQLIAMQPMPVPPLHSPPVNGKLSDANQINKEIQVALRHKSEIEHHRNKIRLRAKRKGHYDFPAMDDMVTGLGDAKDQDRIYQKAQTQIDKILDPDAQMPSVFIESKKRFVGVFQRVGKAGLKMKLATPPTGSSDPDQGQGSPHRSPSPTDDVFLGPASSPPGHAPPPPPYMPPQPSIEEARQQMHSLLDDAFALVSPTSQGGTAGITLPGGNGNPPGSSPPGRGPRPWGPSYQAFAPFPGVIHGLTPRQGLGSGYLAPGEAAGHGDPLQPDSLYSSRGLYADELPSSARPRPVGGTTGAQLHHLTQVGLSSRMNGYPAGVRAAPGQNGGWNHYHDDNFSRPEPEKETPRGGIREAAATPPHLDPPGVAGYLSAPPPLDTSPPTHSSASLIKAIREELLRLSQKQAAVPSYHS